MNDYETFGESLRERMENAESPFVEALFSGIKEPERIIYIVRAVFYPSHYADYAFTKKELMNEFIKRNHDVSTETYVEFQEEIKVPKSWTTEDYCKYFLNVPLNAKKLDCLC